MNLENIEDYNNRNPQEREAISFAYSYLPSIPTRKAISKEVKLIEQGKEIYYKVTFGGVENAWVLYSIEKVRN